MLAATRFWKSNRYKSITSTASFFRAVLIPLLDQVGIPRDLTVFDRIIEARIVRLMVGDTELLREIRDLLLLIAEPALAKRDQRFRAALGQIVGKGKRKASAVILMDGTRAQAAIQKECGIDVGDLSRLVKALRKAELIGQDEKHPKLVFPVPQNFVETLGQENG